ncbi:MAG: PDZ domain-containing protein [Planctomycetes bacterium]|nr:PDZ domain-containing protein [Planctomycetota bacterium]
MLRRHQALLRRSVSLVLVALACGFGVSLYLALKPLPLASLREKAAQRTAPVDQAPPSALSAQDLQVVWRGWDPERAAAQPSRPPEPPRTIPDLAPIPAFKLRGIIYSTGGDSVAFIEKDGKTSLYTRDESVGGWVVCAIEINAVMLAKGGVERRLAIENRPLADRLMTASAAPRTTPASRGRPGAANPGRSRGSPPDRRTPAPFQRTPQRRTSNRPPPREPGVDASVAVPAGLVEQVRNDPTKLELGIRYSWQLGSDGKMRGYRIDKVKPGSLAARYGLAPGDRILAVNGNPINSPMSALSLYQRFRNSDSARVKIERGGQIKEVTYYVR